jgi:hypothetical protein
VLIILAAGGAALWLWLQRSVSSSPYDTGDGATVNTPVQSSDALDNIEEAIARFEGSGLGRNNPGNIKAIPGRSYPGQVGTDSQGFAIGGDEGDGWGWLNDWITSHAAAHPDWDFYDLFNFYLRGSTDTPTSDAQGNSDRYAEFVANYVGADPTSSVAQFANLV